jgi:hypothetical protein
LLDDGIVVSINGRVYADAEDMLVVLGENTGRNHVAPWRCLVFLDADAGDDTSCAGLDSYGTCLIEDVLVEETVRLEKKEL